MHKNVRDLKRRDKIMFIHHKMYEIIVIFLLILKNYQKGVNSYTDVFFFFG